MSERESEGRGASSAPLLTLALAAVALALWAWLPPRAAELLQLSRHGLAAGELWRLLTGHLTHFSRAHLLLDLGAFCLLGVWCELRSPVRTRWFLGGGALAVSLGVLLLEADLATYRGLSGLDSGLMALLLVLVWRDAESGFGLRRLAVTVLAALFLAKLGYESLTDRTVFVDAASAGYVGVPLAHWLGGSAGLLAGTLRVPREGAARQAQGGRVRTTGSG